MAFEIKTLSDLKDHFGLVLLSATSKRFPRVGPFTEDHKTNLVVAFQSLENGMAFARMKMGSPDEMAKLKQMLRESLGAFQRGEGVKGAHLLQDVHDAIFPNAHREYEKEKGN